jgi:serine/threonine protein kinase/Flp pilus assembly protein TadD
MNANRDTDSLRCVATEPGDPELERAARVISDAKKRWRNGTKPDTNAVIAEHPDLLRYRSFVLDLAAEEYRCREASGEPMSEDEFAGRFPGMERSLFFLLEVRRMMHLDEASDLVGDEVEWPEVGDDFLGFSLIAELGRGTFGHVFLASEPSLGKRLVALKVAPQGQWEAEILGKLGHPNIVPVYSIQKDPDTGLTAVCMPYLGRATLLDVIEHLSAARKLPRGGQVFSEVLTKISGPSAKPLPQNFDNALTKGTYIDGVVHLAIQMADALSFTHKQGIYHRDLKPSNVLLTDVGRPLILDFNLSSEETVIPARMGGTLPYMAPEQLQSLLTDRQPSLSPDWAQSDLFSLGVILYELLCGDLPFGVPNMKGDWDDVALDLLARQKSGPRPLRAGNPDVDSRLASLIEQCLAFDPARRPVSAASLVDSLRRQNSAFRRAKRWARCHSVAVATVVAAIVIGSLTCATWLALRDPYPVRLYKEGRLAMERGDPGSAVELFDKALRAAPDNREFKLEHANAIYQEGKFSQALEEYRRIYAEAPSDELVAMQGHCLCQLRYYPEAIARYEQAMAADCPSTSLYNNLGYCLMQRTKYREADDCFRKAVALDPRCSEAWHNLVKLAIKRHGSQDNSIVDCPLLIRNALAAAQPTGELFWDIAMLETLSAHDDPRVAAHAIDHLRQAVALGIDPRQIAREEGFQPLRDTKGFSSLLQLTPRSSAPKAATGVMSPF